MLSIWSSCIMHQKSPFNADLFFSEGVRFRKPIGCTFMKIASVFHELSSFALSLTIAVNGFSWSFTEFKNSFYNREWFTTKSRMKLFRIEILNLIPFVKAFLLTKLHSRYILIILIGFFSYPNKKIIASYDSSKKTLSGNVLFSSALSILVANSWTSQKF